MDKTDMKPPAPPTPGRMLNTKYQLPKGGYTLKCPSKDQNIHRRSQCADEGSDLEDDDAKQKDGFCGHDLQRAAEEQEEARLGH